MVASTGFAVLIRARPDLQLLASVIALATCTILYVTGSPSPEAGSIGMIVSLALPPVLAPLRRPR